MKKIHRKLIPAFAMLMMSTIMLSSASYAWFTMNQEVSATGMKIKASAGTNMLIAEDTFASAAIKGESLFKSNCTISSTATLLAPVSTQTGKTIYYCDAKDVTGDGKVAAKAGRFTPLAFSSNKTNEPSNLVHFQTACGVEGAKPFVDFAFQIKVQKDDAVKNHYLVMDKLNLTYAGNDINNAKAFRVGVFVKDITSQSGINTPLDGSKDGLMYVTGAKHFDSTRKVITGTDGTKAEATYQKIGSTSGVKMDGKTGVSYYKVIVRIYLEGEDDTCTNATFASLTDDWTLDFHFALNESNDSSVTEITANPTVGP